MQKITLNLDPGLVRPLGDAQNEFVQVLLSEFELRNEVPGLALTVAFDFSTPTIWRRPAKGYIQEQLDPALIAQYGEALRGVLLHQTTGGYVHRDPCFPFRFGNGGALPVIRLNGEDYYCLFYRGVHPVGWNIANGGAESAAELLDAVATIERELREELIIVEPEVGNRYVFDWSEGRRVDHPEFAVARAIWQKMFHDRDFDDLRELTLPLKWLSGQDCVRIRLANEQPVEVRGCFININAEDHGIEIDRVAKMSVGPRAIFCDGEVVRGKLLNRPVGLFRVHRFHAAMAAGKREFYPDRIFWNGRDRSDAGIENVVQESMDDMDLRRVFSGDVRSDYVAAAAKFALCPVTDILIRRYLLLEDSRTEIPSIPPAPAPAESYDVFLSFSSECHDLASHVFRFLRSRGRNVFFSDETLHHADFGRAIDSALESARALVVVGIQADHFKKRWVEYEWRTFHQDILGNRKPENTPLVTITQETDPFLLPRPLAHRQILRWDRASWDSTMQSLEGLLGEPNRIRPIQP
jgi:TIR domain